MEPISLATVTAAVTTLANEVAKGVAGDAGAALWQAVKSKLGWQSEPAAAELAPEIAQRLHNDEALAREITKLLQSSAEGGIATALVGKIDAEKVVVADTIHGGVRM